MRKPHFNGYPLMLVGYMRVSSDSDRQSTDLQRDALLAAGIDTCHLFEDHASGAKDVTPTFLLAELMVFLIGQRIVRPGYSTLQTIIRSGKHSVLSVNAWSNWSKRP